MKKNLKHEVGQIDQTTINLVSLSITILQEQKKENTLENNKGLENQSKSNSAPLPPPPSWYCDAI